MKNNNDEKLVYLDGGKDAGERKLGWTGKQFEVKNIPEKDPDSVTFDDAVVYTKGFNTLEEAERYAKTLEGPTVIVDVLAHQRKRIRGSLKQFGGLLDPDLKDMDLAA